MSVRIGDISPVDRRFWPDNPDPGFSPEHNQAVIERTIRKYGAMRARKKAQFKKELQERTDAVASYLGGTRGAHKSRTIEQYFGKRYLARLRGEEIRDELRERLKFVGKPESHDIVDSQGRLKGISVQQRQKQKE